MKIGKYSMFSAYSIHKVFKPWSSDVPFFLHFCPSKQDEFIFIKTLRSLVVN